MDDQSTYEALVVNLAGEVVALRTIIRRLIAHIAVLDGGDSDFLRDELDVVLGELRQFSSEGLSKDAQKLMYARAREIIDEAYGSIVIGGVSSN